MKLTAYNQLEFYGLLKNRHKKFMWNIGFGSK